MRASTAIIAAAVLLTAGTVHAESLEDETRQPPGSSSLHDDSDTMRGHVEHPTTNTLDNDSMERRGRTADQDGTNSLDNGSMDNGGDDDD